VPRISEKRLKARAAWRAWYRRHHEAAKAYYRKRYVERLKAETAKERELRLAQARKNQKKYARRKKKATE
jgi:hypothetical protein